MASGLTLVTQDNFAGGMFQAPDTQRIPQNGTFDIINGLLDADEGVIYRRGGGVYLSNALGETPTRLWDFFLAAGPRTMFAAASGLNVLAANDLTATTVIAQPFDRRPAVANGIAWFPSGTTVYGYGGYRGSFASYTTGTVAVTEGSTTVTGTGTSWTGNLQPGSVIWFSSIGRAAAIQSVDSNTQVTLTAPWEAQTLSGQSYLGAVFLTVPIANFANKTSTTYATTAGGRVLFANGNQVLFAEQTAVPGLSVGATTNYHEVPGGTQITGLDSIRDTAVVFTDGGVYTISNLAYDLTDATGNPQQRMDRVPTDLVLVDSHGIAAWRNTLIVPALDGVYLMDATSAPVPISAAIRDLYRSYIDAGYGVGQAQVYQGHYILPVLNAGVWVDTLVCRLDGQMWSRMSGGTGESVGWTQRVGTAARQPRLLGLKGQRVVEGTGWFSPVSANKNEADGTTHPFAIVTRDFTLASLKALCKKARLWIEGVDAGADSPTISASYATGLAGSSFTSLDGSAGPSTGDAPAGVWTVNAGGKRVRFRFSTTEPWASLKIKALDLFVRPRSRA